MEATFDAINWHELAKFENTGKFSDWRLELETDPEWILDDVGWDNDSAGTYFTFADILEDIVEKLPSEEAKRLKNSLMTVVCGNDSKAVKDFPCTPGSCYFISLSPSTVSSVMENLKKLDKSAVSSLIADNFVSKNPDVERNSILQEIQDYFKQVETLVEAASARGWGILGHAG
jgi:hypothetical protein